MAMPVGEDTMKGHRLVRQVTATLEAHHMLQAGDRVVVACSGGADSLALLYILYLLRDRYQLELYVSHVNHMLRPRGSRAEAAFVRGVCQRLDLPCTVGQVKVLDYVEAHRVSKQVAARILRYRFLLQEAERCQAQKVAVGHTADDQLETVFMWLLRGAGKHGMAGIPPVRDGLIIRPLIATMRQEIEAFLAEGGWAFIADPSNRKRVYWRNRIRHQLLPLLREKFSPQIRQRVLEWAEIQRQEDAFMESQAMQAWADCVVTESAEGVVLDRVAVQNLPLALQRRVLRRSLQVWDRGLQGISFRHVTSMIGLLSARSGFKSLCLPRGLLFSVEGDRVRFARRKIIARPSFSLEWLLPGTLTVPPLQLHFTSHIQEIDQVAFNFNDPGQVYVDYERMPQRVCVRTRRPGDRIMPLGMDRFKRLKKFLIDDKVERPERDSIPLLADGDEILWIVGRRISERVKIRPDTSRVLVMSARSQPALEGEQTEVVAEGS